MPSNASGSLRFSTTCREGGIFMLKKVMATLLSVSLLFCANTPISLARSPLPPSHWRTMHEPLDADNLHAASYVRQVLELVNRERRQRGLSPLRMSQDLMRVAKVRVKEITQEFSHTRPNGQPFSSLLPNGHFSAGENIAAGLPTPEATVQQWMKSPGHRANILNREFSELGVGYLAKPGSTYHHYWVQIFRHNKPGPLRQR